MGEVRTGDDKAFYTSYMKIENPLVQAVRTEAFGEDIGQFSWTTADEMRRFHRVLEVEPESRVLDVACGSGGVALFTARSTDCDVTGVDITDSGIRTATDLATRLGLSGRVRFRQADVSQSLPFEDASFDAIYSIDSINHFLDRVALLKEWCRVLRPGGRILFTDPIVVTGMLTREEIVVRSGSMGLFVFTPLGLDEGFMNAAGFVSCTVEDVTDNIVLVSRNWRAARVNHAAALAELEGPDAFRQFQAFLGVVHRVSSERRLSRLLYQGQKPSAH